MKLKNNANKRNKTQNSIYHPIPFIYGTSICKNPFKDLKSG